ncbi:MAG TPA: hypothetical protein VKS79_04620 [Gemmataceae bacterium]|nr:hypothetical protein [Gemmataceae bacterium]
MFRLLATFACLFALCGVASACLNDSELPGHEREFRSSYKREAPPAPSTDSQPSSNTPLVLYGTGGALLAGAGLMILRRPSTKA